MSRLQQLGGVLAANTPNTAITARRRSPRASEHSPQLGLLVCCCFALFSGLSTACTPVPDYAQNGDALQVQVDADDVVRALGADIELVIESRAPGAVSWTLEASQRFTPSSDPALHDWPLSFRVEGYNAKANYLVTATSRDEAGGVSLQARALTPVNLPSPHEVRLRLDGECLHLTKLCGRDLTCSLGDCVDASWPLRERQGTVADARTQTGNVPASMPPVEIASSCTDEGARACALSDESLPLVCGSGSWQPEVACSQDMKCVSGSCVASGTRCASLPAAARFCDDTGRIYQCQDATTATPSPCGDNERCTDTNGEARCSCLPGFVKMNQVCAEPTSCQDQGGCDRMTKCMLDNGKRVCTACPPGYAGTGETGCAAQAIGLAIAPGALQPKFSADVTAYSASVPFFTSHVDLTVECNVPAQLTINGQVATAGKAWSSPALGADRTPFNITLRTESDAVTSYQVTVERARTTETYLKASNGKRGDQFGGFVDTHADTIVVGAPYETRSSHDPNGESSLLLNPGAAYVFVRDASGWRQQGYLKADEIKEQDYFGLSVALWKDRIAVGAPGDVVSSVIPGTPNGKVHIFARKGNLWAHEATINSPNSVANGDAFGFRVALREDTLLVGAPLDDNVATRSGAVYIYKWDGTNWQSQQRLKAIPAVEEGRYGSAIELSDTLAMVGSFQEPVDGITRAGAAYAYSRSSGEWPLVKRLVSSTPRLYGHFGATLAVDGNLVVVTAPHNPLETSSRHNGEAHVFQFTGTDLTFLQLLQASTPATGDEFAASVALNNGLLLLSAPREKTPSAPHGAVHLYAWTGKSFAHSALLAPASLEDEDYYGYDIALTADRAVVGAPSQDSGANTINGDATDNSLPNSGAVYVFE